jgi:hypothetical protein
MFPEASIATPLGPLNKAKTPFAFVTPVTPADPANVVTTLFLIGDEVAINPE